MRPFHISSDITYLQKNVSKICNFDQTTRFGQISTNTKTFINSVSLSFTMYNIYKTTVNKDEHRNTLRWFLIDFTWVDKNHLCN